MNRNTIIALALVGTIAVGAGIVTLSKDRAPATEEKSESHDHGEEGASTHVKLTAAQVKAAGAVLSVAGPGNVAQTLGTSGTIVFDSAGMARARARFPGIVREVRRNVGDRVSAGEILATVESNESLQSYQVKAPIEGTIIERNASVGEIADTSPLFVIADPTRVWAEAHIFSKDLASLRVDQKVRVRSSDRSVIGDGVVTSILPVTETATQTVIARIELIDKDGRWRPGMIISADIVVNERPASIAIPTSAIQTLNEKPTIFVQDGKSFEIRPILLGLQNNDFVEVLEGLDAGETYVSANSFVMKADAGKASAEHAH